MHVDVTSSRAELRLQYRPDEAQIIGKIVVDDVVSRGFSLFSAAHLGGDDAWRSVLCAGGITDMHASIGVDGKVSSDSSGKA